MTDQLNRERAPSTVELVLDFIKVRFWSLIGAGAAAVAIGMMIGLDLTVPRWVKILGLSALLLSPAGYIVGSKIVSLLWSPNYIYLVDLDARDVDGALYQFPYEDFRQLDVVEGNLCQLTPNLYTGKDVDIDEMTATGTWRGTLDDRELLRALTKVEEVRGTLEDDARRGFILETQAFQIVRAAVRRTTLHVVETFEAGTLPDQGDSLGEEVDKALDRYDLEERLEDELIDQDPSIEEVSQTYGDELEEDPFTHPDVEVSADD